MCVNEFVTLPSSACWLHPHFVERWNKVESVLEAEDRPFSGVPSKLLIGLIEWHACPGLITSKWDEMTPVLSFPHLEPGLWLAYIRELNSYANL